MIKQITLVTNICFEPYFQMYIKKYFSHISGDIVVNSVLYETYTSNLNMVEFADIIAVCLNFEELYPNIANDVFTQKVTYEEVERDCIHKCKELYSNIKAHSNANLVWFSFEDYYCLQHINCGSLLCFDGLIERLNLSVSAILKEDSFVDFKRLIASVGINKAYSNKGKYRWNAPYSKEMIDQLVAEIYKQYLIVNGISKKCLVLDCDNVLWGGVLSEDGIDGIQIDSSGFGKPFHDFQRYLIDLYYHGVILAVCSKNDESDILRVFKEHTGMLLKEEHISCFICNWHSKTDNIVNIAEFLNVGLDSIVFVDDSIFEIEHVKQVLPDVTTILYQRDSIYEQLSCFHLQQNTNPQIVMERAMTYSTNRLRFELKNKVTTDEEYISSLEMVIDIHRTTEYEFARISELTLRTNKCTNGTRYTLRQLKEMVSLDDYYLYSVCLSDKFADLGIVGIIGMKDDTIDLFALSCRALGRKVEERMIIFALEKNAKRFCFFSTNKNIETKNLFESYGMIKK